MKAQGAEVIEIQDFMPPAVSADEKLVLQYEFKSGVNAYLASTPAGGARNLGDLIAFNAASPRETALFGQDIMIDSQARGDLDDPVYVHARDELKSLTTAALDDLFARL